MRRENETTKALARWITHYRLEGEDADTIFVRFQQRFSDLSASVYAAANRLAGIMMNVGRRLAGLSPTNLLSDALGRVARPAETVGVSFLFHWQDGNGKDYYNTIKINARWDSTLVDVTMQAYDVINEIVSHYPGASHPQYEIIPSALYPFDAPTEIGGQSS